MARNERLRVITVADEKFRGRALHLRNSLVSSGNEHHLTIYCDDAEAFAGLASGTCTIKEWPTIRRLGAKRAKFSVYADAASGGGFLWLDADAIVLGPLADFTDDQALCGSVDDLSECEFIADPRFPWPNAPELENRVYFNSGSLYFPAALRADLAQMAVQAEDDTLWQRLIFPGKLFDNHFLFAQVNLRGMPVKLFEPREYQWRGLLRRGVLQVFRRGDELVNRETDRAIRIALFAGAQQSFELINRFPPEVASLLYARCLTPVEPALAAAQLLGALDRHFVAQDSDDPAPVVARVLAGEVVHAVAPATGAPRPPLADPRSLRAISFFAAGQAARWNGLRCGNAYLDGDEYGALRALVGQLSIRRVLETGAGETSILFRRAGAQCHSIESQPGPWVDRALAEGCAVLPVPFDDLQSRFDDAALDRALAAHGLAEVDLLFVDSPTGTERRRNVLQQLLSRIGTKFVLYHDVLRDAEVVFADQMRFGLKLVQFFATPRGLALFELPRSAPPAPPISRTPRATVVQRPSARLRLVAPPTSLSPGQIAPVRVELENLSDGPLSSDLDHPVRLSYHWLDEEQNTLVRDGLRTALPHELQPGDSSSCALDVAAPQQPGRYQLVVTLVQEAICWFDQVDPESAARLDVEVGVAPARRSIGGTCGPLGQQAV